MSSTKGRTNVDLVAAAYEAFGRGDIPTVLSMLDEQVEWHMADHHTYATGGPIVGPGGGGDGLRPDPPGLRRLQHRRPAHRRLRRHGRCRGPVPGTSKATGEALDAQAAHVFDFRDGRCVRYQQYTDTWQFADVTGVVPNVKTVAR